MAGSLGGGPNGWSHASESQTDQKTQVPENGSYGPHLGAAEQSSFQDRWGLNDASPLQIEATEHLGDPEESAFSDVEPRHCTATIDTEATRVRGETMV
jgi:hypothetical protein